MSKFDNLALSGATCGGSDDPLGQSRAPQESLSRKQTENSHRTHSSFANRPDSTQESFGRIDKILLLASFCALIGFSALFVSSVSEWWFNPRWVTDDALQQTYPFHAVLEPGLFDGDPVTFMMEQYLTPLHFGVTALFTLLTQDPVLAGHWVMLLQLVLTLGFIGAGVYRGCGGGRAALIPMCLALVWFLHTRLVVQRLTLGLPRGWAAPLLAAFLCFAVQRNHRAILLTIGIGCLLHPPATLIAALAYGLWLFCEALYERSERTLRPLITLVLISPLFFLVAWLVVKMPPEIGSMATLDVASRMPEFSTPHGRFPFYPLKPIGWEWWMFGFQAFLSRLHDPLPLVSSWLVPVVVSGCALLGVASYRAGRAFFPPAAVFFLVAVCAVYFLARMLAFRLYVPDRHLQIPMALFFIMGLSIAAWRFGSTFNKKTSSFGGVVALGVIAGLVWLGSGSGLQGALNFNYSADKKGRVFEWMRKHTAPGTVIAGEPTLIDGTMLFGRRIAYITTETAHPFYDRYYDLVRPRIERTLRAHYARDLREVLTLLEPEGVEYFVFARRKFYPEALARASYFEPYNGLVRELAGRPWQDFAFRQLPRRVDTQAFPPLVFRDEHAAVVDLKALRRWIDEGRTFPAPVSTGNPERAFEEVQVR